MLEVQLCHSQFEAFLRLEQASSSCAISFWESLPGHAITFQRVVVEWRGSSITLYKARGSAYNPVNHIYDHSYSYL